MGYPGLPGNDRYLLIQDPGTSYLANVQGADYRVVMAIVYPDDQTAYAAHQQAHQAAMAAVGHPVAFDDDNGPRLLSGYGGSVWRGNVALVESTLVNLYTYDFQRNHEAYAMNDPRQFEPGFAPSKGQYGVDNDIVSCLDSAALMV